MKTLTALITASLLAGGVAFANEKGPVEKRPVEKGSVEKGSASGGMHGGGMGGGMMGGGMGGGMMGGGMPGMMNMMRHMQTMDANGDGMLSKEEFIKSHEAMFDSMAKNKEGLVDMKSMSMCPMMGGQPSR